MAKDHYRPSKTVGKSVAYVYEIPGVNAKLDKPRTEHIGLRLTKDVRGLLDALVENEQARVGPAAKVHATSMLEALILAEAERRGLSVERGRKKKEPLEHLEDAAKFETPSGSKSKGHSG